MKQSSRMYGIKVKEQINYYPYNASTKSEGIDDIILSYSEGYWIVTSNYDNNWMNGNNYPNGSEILRFQDGDVRTYDIMAQYTDETPYKNYHYYIYSNAAVNPDAGFSRIEYQIYHDSTKDFEFEIHKKVNGMITQRKRITSEDVKNYKLKYSKEYYSLSSWHMLVDFYGQNPQSGYDPYSFRIISDSDNLKDLSYNVIQKGTDICTFRSHSAPYYIKSIIDETQKAKIQSKSDNLPVVQIIKKLNSKVQGKMHEFNKETIIKDAYYDHKDIFYNGMHHKAAFLVYDNPGVANCWTKKIESIALTFADPFWFLMTTKAGILYQGQTLEARKLIKSWKYTDNVSLSFSQVKSRKKSAPKDAPYDDIVYDVVSTSSNVTVTKLIRHKYKDSQGRTHTEETQDGEPIVFTSSDSPVTCWNIQFRITSGITWTIFSKCGYIRYGGRSYPTNRSILSFDAGEEMHIEISDDTNKYEVEERITYTLDNEQTASINYRIFTPEIDPVIKVEKTVNNEVEPWTTIHYYDAMVLPYEMDDFLFDYDNTTRTWTLTSSSDTLYSEGINYKEGEVIATWNFNDKIDLHHIVVLTNSSDNNLRLRTTSSKGSKINSDIDEQIPSDEPDLQILHSAAQQLWEIKSINDQTWVNGVQYLTGQTIFSVKDKVIVDAFVIMVMHTDVTPYVNKLYSVSFSYDPINDLSSITVVPDRGVTWSRTNKELDPGNLTYIFNKDNLKSLYGYIWKRGEPGPGPTPLFYNFIIAYCRTNRTAYSERLYSDFMGFKNDRMVQLRNSERYDFKKYFYVQQKSAKQYFIELTRYYVDSSLLMGIDSEGEFEGTSFNQYEIPLMYVNNTDILCLKLNSNNTSYIEAIILYRTFEEYPKTEIARLTESHSLGIFVRNAIWNVPNLYFLDPMDYVHNSLTNTIAFINNTASAGNEPQFDSNTFSILDISNMQFLTSAADWSDIFYELNDTYDSTTGLDEIYWSADDVLNPSTISALQKHDFSSRAGFALKEDGIIYVYFFLRIIEKEYDGGSYIYRLIDNHKVSCFKLDAKANTRTLMVEVGEETQDYYELISYTATRIDACPCIKYDNNFYYPLLQSNKFKVIKIVPSTGVITVEKTIDLSQNPDTYISVNIYYSRDMSSHDTLKVYFDTRSWDKENLEVGLFSMHFQRQYLSNRYYYCFHVSADDDPNFPSGGNPQSYGMYLLIDNPLINSSSLNMAFLETAIIN